MKITRSFDVSFDFKDKIINFADKKGMSVSALTDLLFYEYWKGRAVLDYKPLKMESQERVHVSIHPDNLQKTIDYRRNIASHVSLRWVFVSLWEQAINGSIEV